MKFVLVPSLNCICENVFLPLVLKLIFCTGSTHQLSVYHLNILCLVDSKASELGKAVRFETRETGWCKKWEHHRINLQQRIALRNVMDSVGQHQWIMHQSKPHLK